MAVLVGKQAPDFTATAVYGNNEIKELKLSDFKGKPVVLFFYPLDFTFVCPSELIAFDHRLEEFAQRGVQVIGVSIDSQFTHQGRWYRPGWLSAGGRHQARHLPRLRR